MAVGITETLKSSLQNDLEEFSYCSICTLNFDGDCDPRVLTCQHTFCKDCLEQWKNTTFRYGNQIECPVCRQMTNLSHIGIDGLPRDHKAKQISDILKKYSEIPVEEDVKSMKRLQRQPSLICSLCMDCEVSVDFVCIECEDSLCDLCSPVHIEITGYEDHKVVSVGGSKLLCLLHSFKLLKFYCEDCQEACCTVCVALVHKGHTYKTLETIVPLTNRQLQEQVDQLMQLAGLINQEKQEVIQFKEDLHKSHQENVQNVERQYMTNNLNFNMKDKVIKLLKENQNENLHNIEIACTEKESLLTRIEHLEDVSSQLGQMTGKAGQLEFLSLAADVLKEMKDWQVSIVTRHQKPIPFTVIKFLPIGRRGVDVSEKWELMKFTYSSFPPVNENHMPTKLKYSKSQPVIIQGSMEIKQTIYKMDEPWSEDAMAFFNFLMAYILLPILAIFIFYFMLKLGV